MPGQTGPTTRHGKANSSQNARKHGMRSRTIVLRYERQEDFDRLAAGWRAEYEPDGQAAESLIERVILGDWFLRRAETVYMDAECDLAGVHPLDWTPEQHARMALYLRYKITAERSFYRAFQALRGLRKDKIREELDWENVRKKIDGYASKAVEKASGDYHEKSLAPIATRSEEPLGKKKPRQATLPAESAQPDAAQPEGRAKALFKGQHHPKKLRKVAILDQWVEVEIHEGKTVTKLYPSNAGLIKEGQAMDPPPDLVYRRFNFPHGIPSEYHWVASSHPERFERGGSGLQRMTVDTWLDVIEREEASGAGHVGPTGVGNLPRPKERGGCDCSVCTHNRELLEHRASGD